MGMKNQVILLFLALSLGIKAQEIPEREIHYRPGDWISYPVTRFVTSIALGYQYTYFGTTGGIARYDFYRNAWDSPFTVSNGMANDRIRAVAYDFITGTLWCATDSGLSFYVSSAEEWRNISYSRLGIAPVSSIGNGKKYLWLESSGRLFKGNHMSWDFSRATPEEEAKDEVQWKGNRETEEKRLLPNFFMDKGYLFSPEGTIHDIHLRQFDVTEALRDKFDKMWIGTWGLGCGVADMKTFNLKLLPLGPYTSEIDAMAWDDGGMWIGGHHSSNVLGGITWWDMDRNGWIYFEAKYLQGLRSDEINSIAVDTDFVWFGTNEGLARYDKNKNNWRVFNVQDNLWDDRITSVVLGDRVLWVGTAYGINRVLLPGMVVEQVKDRRLIHRYIYQLEFDGEDIWAGTDRGIFHYIGKEKHWERMPGYPGMVTYTITAVSAWDNEVWFGTTDGVEVYNKRKKQWQGFPSEHYPTSGVINTILADSSAVWVGTEKGVLKYNKKENRWRRFTTNDGLLDNSVRWILLDGDYIWLGTKKGLTRFYWNAPYRTD